MRQAPHSYGLSASVVESFASNVVKDGHSLLGKAEENAVVVTERWSILI